MSEFPYTVYMLIFDSAVALWFGARNYFAYLKNRNDYNKMFYNLGLGVSFSMLIYGFPLLIISSSKINGIFYILAALPLFWGLSYAVKFSLLIWNYNKVEKIFTYAAPVVVLVFVFMHFTNIPLPVVVNGILIRNVPFPYDYIFAVLLSVVTIFPSVAFFRNPVKSKRGIIKKTLFGTALVIGGIGGLGIVIVHESINLIFSLHILLFTAFLILIAVSMVDLFFESKSKDIITNTDVNPI